MATKRFGRPAAADTTPRRTRRWVWVGALCLAGAGLTILVTQRERLVPRGSDSRPLDVLLITIDTLRADALGSYGNAAAATPWIDRLAAAGLRFDSAHAHNVVTLPSHANILSGRYPFVHGVRDNAGFRFPQSMDTLATILKTRGYRTGAFVSAFPLDARFGLARGFDEYDDRLSATAPPAFLEQERAGTETVARARAWLAGGTGQPTFCWVHLYEPHFPYAPPEPFASRFQNKPYAGEVAAADAALGPLLEPTLAAGAQGHTLVVLTADHGESLDEHGEATHGIFAYEATLRVPLILYVPALLKPAVRREFVRHIDILPTVLDLLSIPAPAALDGHSLRSTSTPQADSERSYFEALSGTLNRGWAPLHGMIEHGLKYIDLPIPELYDLADDSHEQHNLADARPDDVKAFRSLLVQLPNAVPHPAAEDALTSQRLRSLGYVSGGPKVPNRYTVSDDPKQLIGIDRELQQILDLYLRGGSTAALDRARRLAKEQVSMPLAWLQLAHLERESGNLPGAIDALTRAHALSPSNSQVTSLLGGYLTQAGRAQEAVTLLSADASRPDADIEVLTTLALARARLGSTDEALALLGRAKAEDPGSAVILVNEGTVQLMAGRRNAARSAFEQALARDPSSPRAHSSLGAMAIEDGRMDEALSQWRAAVGADPGEYAPIFALGVGHARSGRPLQARACLQFFADHAPPGRYANEIAQARGWLAMHP